MGCRECHFGCSVCDAAAELEEQIEARAEELLAASRANRECADDGTIDADEAEMRRDVWAFGAPGRW